MSSPKDSPEKIMMPAENTGSVLNDTEKTTVIVAPKKS
jgi:hypothetical protein